MTWDLLVATRGCLAIGDNLKDLLNLSHLPSNGIHPEGVAILAVKVMCFGYGLWHFNAEFMSPF